MNLIQIKGGWNILKGRLKQKCAHLTHDEQQYFAGKADELIGRIQLRSGRFTGKTNGIHPW